MPHTAPLAVSPTAADHPRPAVLIASEIRLLGEGLAMALGREGTFRICGCAGDIEDTPRQIALLHPDIVLLNAALQTGMAAIRQIRAAGATVKIVALAVAEDPTDVIAWAEAGAAGYIPSSAGLDDVVPLLSNIMRGEQPISGRVAAGLLQRLHDAARQTASPPAMAACPTARELQILEMIGTGLTNKEIARRLNIGLATTKSHVHNLLGKLGLQRRGQAASWMHDRQARGANASRPANPANN